MLSMLRSSNRTGLSVTFLVKTRLPVASFYDSRSKKNPPWGISSDLDPATGFSNTPSAMVLVTQTNGMRFLSTGHLVIKLK